MFGWCTMGLIGMSMGLEKCINGAQENVSMGLKTMYQWGLGKYSMGLKNYLYIVQFCSELPLFQIFSIVKHIKHKKYISKYSKTLDN